MNDMLIYGAYGYTGKLIVAETVKRGWKPTIAGRNEVLVKALAHQYDLPSVSFKYDDQQAWDRALKHTKLLLNCAGPFSLTIKEILPACIRNKVHYTDITGEIEVYKYIQAHDDHAQKAGIVLMPGIGFDVVPTDCLAKYLSEQLPSASHLEMAFDSTSGLSRGTALSVLNRFHKGSAIREGGIIMEQPAATTCKEIDYYNHKRFSVGIAWGDVFTAYYSTGIPNIQVFTTMSEKLMKTMQKAGKWNWLIKTRLVQMLGRYIIRRKIVGPSEAKRESLKAYLWGRVYYSKGNEVQAQMTTPESYKLTALTTVLCVDKILKAEAKPGYQTPAGCFGCDLIMEVDGVHRELIQN